MYKGILLMLLLLVQGCSQVKENSAPQNSFMPEVRLRLLEMAQKDQEARKKLTPDRKPDSAVLEQLRSIDSINTQNLKKIFDKNGWPDVDMVGRDGVNAFWLVLQHSSDYAFQKKLLPFVTQAFKRGEINGQKYALFVDRQLIHDGKPQRYGTQIKGWDGQEPVLFEIEDPKKVETLRAELGIFPLEEYLFLVKQQKFPSGEFDRYLNGGKREGSGWIGMQVEVEGEGSLHDMTLKALIISHIVGGSPAEKAGLRIGEKVVEIEGVSIYGRKADNVMELIEKPVGEEIHLIVESPNGEKREVILITDIEPEHKEKQEKNHG